MLDPKSFAEKRFSRQRERQRERERETERERKRDYYRELAHLFKDAKKYQDPYTAKRRPRRADSINFTPGLSPKAGENQRPSSKPFKQENSKFFSFLKIYLFYFIFYCTLGSGVHVQIMQDYCIGTHMARWFLPSSPHHLYLVFLPTLSLPTLPTCCCPSPNPCN